MNVNKLDYVVANMNEKGKKALLQVISVDPLRAVVCDDNKKNTNLVKHVEFELTDIVCNFGIKPLYGNAYGVQIERVITEIQTEPWEIVRFFKKYSDVEHKLIMKSLDRVSKELLTHNIFPKQRPITVHIKEPKGPHAGMYRASKTKENEEPKPDNMELRVFDFGEIDYIAYHEMGHGVWHQLMDDEIKSRWVKMFYQHVSLISDFHEKVKNMRGELIKAGSLKDYLSDLDEDDVDLMKHIRDTIKKQYNISPLHLNILIAADDDLSEIWPKKLQPISQAQVLVTEYGTKNPDELFCESFAHHFHPQKQLPKSLQKLMDQTIASSRYSQGMTSADRKK